jgi:hypothetical protein
MPAKVDVEAELFKRDGEDTLTPEESVYDARARAM